jgi:hypothetical protein
MKLFLALALATSLAAPAASATLPVFPGAVGFGTTTKAGRDAVDDAAHIYHVTRLDDPDYTNPPVGTLRNGIETSTGPRVIVFDVSGVIELRRDLIVRATTSTKDHGYLTIAGQTAPFPGITLKNGGFRIYSHDILIQHIGIRPGDFVIGDETDPDAPDDGWLLTRIDNRDCIGLEEGANNIVIDHVSCSWTTDETFTTWGNATPSGAISNITFSNNIYAYPLWFAGHTNAVKGHGLGLLVGPGSSNVSIVRNVMAFAQNRNPLIRGQTAGAQVINNFVFRPGATRNAVIYVGRKFDPDDDPSKPPFFETKVSAIGNLAYLMRERKGADAWHGLENDAHQEGFYVHDHANLDTYLYLNGNYTYQPDIVGPAAFQPRTSALADQYSLPYYANYPGDGRMTPTTHRLSSDPYASTGGVSNPIVGPPAYLKWKIVPGAGKFSGQRDFYDADLMKKINDPDDDSAWLYSQDDLNGGADPWAPVNIQHTRTFAVTNPTGDDDSDGYTNLEEELHRLAAIVEGRIPMDPTVSKFDYFTDDASEGWTTAISGAGGSWAVTNHTLVQSLTDQNSRAILNGSNWTDQVVETKVDASAFNGTSFVAVYARFKSLNDAYYLTLRSTGAVELKRIVGGVVTPFASLPAGSYDPLAAHVLRLEVVGNSLRGFVDGSLVLSGTDNEWSIDSGKAGVGTFQASAAFDNVFASPFPSSWRVPDDFDDGDANGWDMTETGASSWSTAPVSTGSENWVLNQTQTTGNHRSKRGGPHRDESMQAKVRFATASDPSAFIAVYARYQDVNNTYYLLLRNSRTLELKKIVGGTSAVTFATLTLPTSFDLTAWHTLRIEATGGNLTTLKAYLDGQLQLVGSDVDSPFVTGWAAVGSYLTSAQFDDLVISQP